MAIKGFILCVLGIANVHCILNRVVRDIRPSSPPCPEDWDITPCTCTGRAGTPNMDCSAIKDADSLRKIFQANPKGENFRAIEIHGSSLNALPGNLFGNHNFYLFYLNDNQIEMVDKDAFRGSEESAQLMRLDNNKLTSFPFESLENLKYLRVLQLERNQLTQVPDNAFPQLPDLQVVDLSENKITTLGKSAFSKLSALMRLDLANNQLTSEGIDESSFTGLTSLQSLDLSHNQLVILDEKIFGDLLKKNVTILVESNPLKCQDSAMAWMKDFPASSKDYVKNFPC